MHSGAGSVEQNNFLAQKILTEFKWIALIGYPDTYYNIRGIRQETSYINKDSAVDEMRDSLHMPMGEVTISML